MHRDKQDNGAGAWFIRFCEWIRGVRLEKSSAGCPVGGRWASKVAGGNQSGAVTCCGFSQETKQFEVQDQNAKELQAARNAEAALQQKVKVGDCSLHRTSGYFLALEKSFSAPMTQPAARSLGICPGTGYVVVVLGCNAFASDCKFSPKQYPPPSSVYSRGISDWLGAIESTKNSCFP